MHCVLLWAVLALDPQAVVTAARAQIGVTTRYDPAYVKLAFPNGDVPLERGVCTDVVVRALRTVGIDLQSLINHDMGRGADRNIDHRRVPNQMRWFEMHGWTARDTDYRPGDIVSWKLRGSGLNHIGVVSDRRAPSGTPLIIHNIGQGTQENDILFAHEITGHYRAPKK